MAGCTLVVAHCALRTIVGAVEFAGTNEPAQKRSWFQEPFGAARPPVIGLLGVPHCEACIDGVAQHDFEHVQRFVHGARQVDVPAVETGSRRVWLPSTADMHGASCWWVSTGVSVSKSWSRRSRDGA